MSWSCSLELVEEFRRQGCLDIESSARLKEIRTAEKSSWLDRKTGQSRPSPSGTTPEPLTASLGVERWRSSLEGSRVSPSVRPGEDEELTTTGTCGPTPSESYARYDRDSSSWKTCPDLFGCTFPASWETWPMRGSMRNGVVSERETLGLPTFARDSGSIRWPTPTSRDHKDGTKAACQNVPVNCLLGRAVHVGSTDMTGSLNPSWVEWLMGWPIGWTVLDPSATDRYHSVMPQLGGISKGEVDE
jgi:hypothetical protein